MKELTLTQLWQLSAEGLHTEEYVKSYIDALEFILRDKNLKILDTACGTGFPLVPLIERGFKNVEASDADEVSVKELTSLLSKAGINTKVHQGLWQELDQKIKEKFDVVLNLDNSFVYMDGWDLASEHSINNFKTGKDHAFERAKIVLKSFLNLLNDGGFVVIGLGKHYELPSRTYDTHLSATKGGKPVQIKWTCSLDWDTREHVWLTTVSGEDAGGQTTRKSYLYTKLELAQLMREAGYKQAHILEPDGTRDNFIIGIK